ncbi:MAG: DUF92 domain-containing protein [Thermoplasmata archaeon]
MLISLLLLLILAILSLTFKVFDFKGTMMALFVGVFVTFLGSLEWLILMLVFVVASFIATKAWFRKKASMHLQEGKGGERKTSNVAYAAVVGLLITLIHGFEPMFSAHLFELFAISFSVIAADTFASEIGVLDSRVWLITNFKRVKRGINGGVSVTGEFAALLGGFVMGISYSILAFHSLNLLPIIYVAVAGFVGCQIDSLLGSLFENRGKLNKGQVNLLASFITVAAYAAISV